MGELVDKICRNCEYFDDHRSNTNVGSCVLDSYAIDGPTVVEWSQSCNEWIERSED